MSIYNALYGRDGHGVGPNEPEKKGFARFCQMVGRDLGQLLGTNLMVCVLCLPALAGAWARPGGGLKGNILSAAALPVELAGWRRGGQRCPACKLPGC